MMIGDPEELNQNDNEDTEGELYPGVEEDEEDEEQEVTENEDGSATVTTNPKIEDQIGSGTSAHFDNLAETIDQSTLSRVILPLVELIEKDKQEQSKRDKLYADGLKQTGLTEDAPGGADFPGASRATHPLILEAAIDSAASIYKELHPADGPCRTKFVGDAPTEQQVERGDRIKAYMNYQLTDEIMEYEEELDQLVSQVPLAGSQFMEWWWDAEMDRPCVEYVPQDKMYLPYTEAGFYSARRKTRELNLDQGEYDRRVAAGIYADIPAAEPSQPDQSKAQKANDKITGESPDPSGLDQPYALYKSWVYLDIPEDTATDGPAPYVATIRIQDNVCVQLIRNWEEEDERKQPMDWVIEYPYIRWRGSLTLGLMSVIGGLSKAATGALRALLDSAFVNNSPSLLKMRGARFTGQTQQVSPVGINEVEATPGTKDIRQLLMAFPYNPTSPVLFELLGFLVTAGKGVVTTAEEKISDASNQMPVGTALALIEQGGKVFSSIHKRLHKAQKRALKLLYRLNRMYLTKKRVIEELGQLVVKPEDFIGPCPIIPVSDPNIFSDSQRVAQIQGVIQLSTIFPEQYNRDEVNERALKLLKIPDSEGLLNPRPKPKDLNPVAENMAMALGKPATAFPEQDHLAHIQSHLTFYQDPVFGQNPLIMPGLVGNLAEHIKQHLTMLYAKMMYDAATAMNNGEPIDKLIQKDKQHREAFDQLMAVVGELVAKKSGLALQKALPVIQQLAQQAQQMKPPMPMDPTAVQAQAVQVEAQRVQAQQAKDQQEGQAKVIDIQTRAKKDQQDAALKAQQQQQQAQAEEAKQQRDMAKKQAEIAAQERRDRLRATVDANIAANRDRIERERIASQEAMNEEDNRTATLIAAARAIDAKEKVGNIKDGSSMTNPNPGA